MSTLFSQKMLFLDHFWCFPDDFFVPGYNTVEMAFPESRGEEAGLLPPLSLSHFLRQCNVSFATKSESRFWIIPESCVPELRGTGLR